ncbi:hypothetical protein V3C99_004446 [Haemonchus contortus]|uniref:RNA-directed DNA polymerase n=1 Tax=Haemonchus contortus TaxID=6289 RepID=A0A7I5E621_HAECO
MDKCNFLMPQLRYLGNIIDFTGRRPDSAKIEVIRKMPHPTDVGQVRSFLGMLNYYGHFISEMRQLRASLDELLKKNVPFNWSVGCQDAFQRAKDVLASNLLLTHYDPTKEIVIAADASEYGLRSSDQPPSLGWNGESDLPRRPPFPNSCRKELRSSRERGSRHNVRITEVPSLHIRTPFQAVNRPQATPCHFREQERSARLQG